MKYRKKPVTVDAWQIGDYRATLYNWVQTAFEHSVIFWDLATTKHLYIESPEGRIRSEIGEWLIRDESGALWPISDEIFRNQYEVVE